MTFTFKPAKREGVHVILGLSGGTGAGKTFSAFKLAAGMAQGAPFAVIDTEAGRALQYADYFDFQHGDLRPPFSPERYLDAIVAAETGKYPVVVVDSFSHEHAGQGGILDIQEDELDRLAKGKTGAQREKYNMLSWARAKKFHKRRLVPKLLQLRTHLILCFRAEPKVKPVKVGRDMKIVDMGWQPIGAKNLDFEMAANFMLRNERPGEITTGRIDQMAPTGYPVKLPEPLKEIFKGTYMLSRKHGEAVAKWAAGAGAKSNGSDPRSLKQMIKEDYVDDAGISPQAIGKALVAADLKGPKQALPEGTDRAEVRAILDTLRTGPQ